MKNARNNGQKRVKNCLKWTASGLLLALMFVLVFAGTLSGAFGIENELQQNGIIQSNVASAAGVWYGNTANAEDKFSVISLEDTFRNTESKTIRINPNVDKRGGMWTTNVNQLKVNTWETDGDQGGKWYIGKNDGHTGKDFACAWFVLDLGENYKNRIYGNISISFTAKYTMWDAGGMIAIESGDNLVELPQSTSDGDSSWYDKVKNGFQNTGASCTKTAELVPNTNWIGAYKETTHDINLTHNVTGRYVRLHFATYDSGDYNEHQLNNVSVTLTRTLAYNRVYDKNGMKSDSVVDAENNLEFMKNSTLTSSFYVGKDQYFTNWNTSADGSGVAMAIGASTGTSTAANTFGGVVKSNLQKGQTSTTLYAQYKEIPFEFNGVPYNTYNPQETNLVVLEGKSNYISSTIDGYATSIEYKNAAGVTIPQPDEKGKYTATITVKKGGVVRGTRTVEFEIVEGDFGKIQGGTGKWGSVTNPYVISNETHLKNLSAIVNGRDALNSIVGSNNNSVTAEHVVATSKTYKDCYFVVAADLGTADAKIELVPIGKDSTHYFAGTIFGGNDSDSNNRTMRTIWLNIQQKDVSNVGLFGYVQEATISYLTTAGSIAGGAAVGGLVGYADGVTISNCRNNASISGKSFIGGIVGKATNATINASHNTNTIQGSSTNVGGILGGSDTADNNILITSCYNTAKISGIDNVGGITGRFAKNGDKDVKISNCYNLGEIFGTADSIGGIVGFSENGCVVEYCYNKAKITGSYALGGIVGSIRNEGSIRILYCYADFTDEQKRLNATNPNSATGGVAGGIVSGCFAGTSTANIKVENSWAIYKSSSDKYTDCKKQYDCITTFAVAPRYFDGTNYVDKTWTDILTVNINAFQILGGTESGKFLALHDGSNKSTLPNKTVIDKEKNSTGSPAKTDLVVHFIVYYNADTKQNVVAELKSIEINAAAVDYNATEQYVVDNTQLPTTVNTHYFKQSFYFDQNGGGNATLGKTNAGTYKVYSDVWIRANNTDYFVGRKESTWTIKKLKFTIGNNQFFYGQDIENAIKNQIVIKNQSNGIVPKEAYTVVFGFNDTEHNFYGSIDIDQNQKEFSVAKTIISIYDSSNTLINDNFDINGFSVIVKAGDFGVQNNGINKSNIENNLWGSESNPYIIGTRDQLVTLSNIVRGATNATNSWYTSDVYKYVKGTIASYGGAYFKLARSIASIGNITPIGTISNVFAATFDGNNNNLSGLNINKSGNYIGLFGCVSGATIKNLTVNGSVKGSSNVGGVVGYALNSTIENVTNNASISSTTDKYVDYSIVRYHAHIPNSGEGVDKIKDRNQDTKYCTSSYGAMSFVIEVPTGTFLTGFTIQNADDTNNNQKRTPKEVYIWGSNVKPTLGNNTSETPYGKSPSDSGQQGWELFYENDNIGLPSTNSTKQAYAFNQEYNYKYYWIRVVGKNKQIQFAEFEVLTQGGSVGGVVGYAKNTSIEGATNTATVNAGSNVGGIVGEFNSLGKSVSGATNSGAITSSNTAAGIVGKLTAGSISGSKNTGRVTASVATTIGGHTGAFLGGIAGWADGNVNNCYNSGTVTTETSWGNSNIVGGIVGFLVNGKTVSYCYNSGNVVGSDNIGGIVGINNGTVSYCYQDGALNDLYLGTSPSNFITSNGGAIEHCWILPGASQTGFNQDTTPNGRKLEVGQNKYVPATIADYAEHSWLDILTVEINGFRVQESVGNNQFFCSDNGTDATYVKPSKTEGFVGDNGDVTAWYSATIASNIRVRVQNITLPNIGSKEYDGSAHGFGHTTYPNTANGATANSPTVYTTEFLYVGTIYKQNLHDSPTDVDVYNATITIKIDGQIVGVKKGDTVTITERLLKVSNVWTSASEHGTSDASNVYIFHYNDQHQGIKENGISVEAVNGGFVISQDVYTIGGYVETKQAHNDTTYTRTFILNDKRNYKIHNKYSQYDDFDPNTQLTEDTSDRGISEATVGDTIVVTYTWKIVPFDFGADFNKDNVWFGGTTSLIVGNQNIANVEVGTISYADMRFYPLQSAQNGVQQVLVYSGHNYAQTNFVVYVKYNNGIVAELNQGTDKDYTVGTLDTSNNTVGTFDENVVSQTNPVQDTNVTASGTGNFSGIVTKWYTALFSDFGWKEGKTPEDNDWGGSADNPYVISKPEHLLRLSQIVNGGIAWNSIKNTVTEGLCISPQGTAVATSKSYAGAYFLVTADIDMTGNVSTDGVYNFLPIGHRNEQSQTDMPFSGTFDGNGKKIKFEYNVNLNHFYNNTGAHSDYVGLFGYIAGYKVDAEQRYATIKNLSIESTGGNEVSDNGGIIGKDYVGGIVGYAVDSKLYNVSVMYGGWLRGENYVGGIVGYGENTWLEVGNEHDNAITYANVGGIQYVGGIVGKWIVRSEEQIGGGKDKQEYITTTLGTDVNGTQYVGGLVGWLDTSACADSVVFAPIVKGSDQNKNVVKGTEYVGALFGVVVGNGYHQSATQGKYTAIVISDQKLNNITLQTNTNAKVVGGLVGYAESVGILFETDWNTSSTTFTLDDSTSFFGGVVGVLGKNSTIEAIIVTKEGDGSYLTGSEHTILNNTALGASGKPIGSFVGGIVGYVSSQAGTYWEANTTIFGNGISLVNSGQIHATGYAGGIFGALGDLSTSVAQTFENDTNSILYNVLTTGVRSGNANTTLGIAPTVASAYFTGAKGKLVNSASLSVTDGYVGGIAGYSGAKVRFVLRNTPQTGAFATENLNVYSGGNDIYINGSYAGGIAGYLVENLEHELQYIVVQAKFDSANAKRVGGLVGYMGSGKVENCVVTNGGNSNVNESTDTFKGSEYVGGLVGETQNAIITNSVSTGFNLDKTTNTKGGVLGGGTNPTIEASWTFYIAKSGATYQTVSKNTYGKYILVDTDIVTINGSSYPTFENLCGFAGIASKQGVTKGVLEFDVNMPRYDLNANLNNKQLAFYDASGSDNVSTNFDSGAVNGFENKVKEIENINNVVTTKLDMASGTSMQICVVKIEFVNISNWNSTNPLYNTTDGAQKNVENAYKKPSNSSRYVVDATNNNDGTIATNPKRIYDDDGNVRYILANVYFNWQATDGTVRYVPIGSSNTDYVSDRIGTYDSEVITPGSSAENPLTISNQKEWNDFAWNVYSGANDYKDKYIKLLTSGVVIDNKAHYGTASGITPLNFGNATNKPTVTTDASDNVGYNFAGNISQGVQTVSHVTIDGVTGTKTPSFKGHFDGNGNTITINYDSGGYNRVSVFPNASNATFKNLIITGGIDAGTNKNNAGREISAFVGKPFGAISFKNCTNTANIQGLRIIAGIVGYSTSDAPIELIGCVNKGNITSYEGSEWTKNAGQDIGYPKDYAYGTGGLIAYATNNITIDSCLNTGAVIGQTKVGGLVGRVTEVTIIQNSANIGNITGEETNPFNDNDPKNKAGNAWSRVGGLVGEASKTATLKMYACYNTGAIRGKSNIAGGLVGILGTIPDNQKPHSTVADNTSTIAYCYNTGEVTVGWDKFSGVVMIGGSGYNFNGTDAGGLVGVAVKLNVKYSYNTGDIHGYGGVGYLFSWQVRNGGILAEACTNASNHSITIANCYSTGRIYIEENNGTSNTRYSADIIGYMDGEAGNDSGVSKVTVSDCYGIAKNIVSYEKNNIKYFSGWNNQSGGDVKYVRTGTTLNSLSDLTAIMRSDGSVKPRAFYYANNQNNEVELWNASTSTIGAQGTTDYQNGTLGGYVYVYGCLPQLAVFAVDTYNGLSMNSQNFGKDIYGEYKAQKAGEEYSPYVIRDGIDLMGVQTLVGLGYTFDGKYIEFANGKNNITLDQNLSSDVAKSINMPISNSTSSKIADSENAYKSLGKDNTYHIGKSYHLFKLSAVCYDDNNVAANTAYGYWLSSNHYYNGAYGNKEGAYKNYATFKTQNILTIGRNGKVFKGSISGKQENNANTVINNLRITSGQTTGGAYGGLFGHVENAYIGYIEVGGESNIWAYSSDNQQIAATGAIAGYVTGDSVIEHCAVSGTTAIGAYGKNDDTHIASDITYAGGIVGLVNPKKGTQYEAGISAIIKDCTVNISTTTGDRAAFAGIIQACKSNIGGVLGYVGGDAGANGKGNSVRIEGCEVQKAAIQAASSAKESSHIGGVLGYGSEYVAAFITGCKVGNSADTTDTVTIKGEHSLGGIAGGMSNAKGGYIDSCTVGTNTTIERINQGGGNISENPKHGTAIGGLVGFTQNSNDDTSPLTTTFSGTSKFLGTINVTVGTTNPGEHGDKKPVGNVGGIVGDMGSGANFASGSNVTVGGTINVTLAAANVGGVAGRTSNATFIGKFEVRPTMNTTEAENVGGFIGKNVGTVYILADTTERIVDGELNGTNITIGGTIRGTSEVGGFIGVNNSGSSLNIGSNVANAKPYRSGTLSITIENGTITGGDNVGGIVGKNEGADGGVSYASIDIVKGTITQQGTINGANNVGGIIGLNDGLLTTGGGEADTSIGGIALSDDQIGSIKNLSITNNGNVTGSGKYVGGVVGKLDSPATLRTEDSGKGAIAGTFTNSGSVAGNSFVGGSLGFVGKNVTITAKNNVATLFVNDGEVNATGYFVGGSIGALVGKIQGENSSVAVKFENKKKVNATGFVGGSIGVLAGPVSYAQFVNSSDGLEIAAVNSVGGSVGYIGVPSPLSDELVGFTAHQIDINNTHFEASGNLTANPSQDAINAAKKDKKDNGWGGVGGAIGVMGAAINSWTDNTYYANGNVSANVIENGIETGIYNVGGIVGLINANDITIGNLLAYNIIVTGAKNVGGIVGATNGTNTKILSAYTIEGTFSGTENVGGIIGLANSTEGTATDAKTSYWVKGYSNAVLAGADVKDLQQTLGKFETIVEQVTVEGKQQSIVFTEDFCKLYTPKTYYADYPGTHTYNGKTVTPGENVEQLTWDNYFKDKLGETSAQIKNGAWVKTVAYAVTFTTGTEKTGWYFAFANDATGANGLGTINTNHQGGGEIELKYWKRIANAYTAQERADKEDTGDLNPPSNIVSDGQPIQSTLYATATAAGEDSGYYLYMATSGQSRPTATYSTNKFFIQVLTTTTTQAELAQNVAIYYRTISKGKTLTYNGYLRYAPVGITVDDGKTVPYVQTPQQDAAKKDSYCYSADTTTGGNATGGAQIDPGNYESAVKIYYYDKDGNPHVVGGVSIKWEIKARQLSADIKSDPHRVYGDNRNQDDGHDMKVVISNIAPGAGTPPQFVITVTDKSSNPNVVTTFKYNGNTLSETKNGITLTATSVGTSSNNGWEASDNLYNVNEPTDITTKDVLFYIDFTNAKTYEVSVAMEQGDWTKRYTLDANKDFIVNPAPLDLTRSNPASEKYDGTAKSATWFISGFKYQDGAKEFAAFQPQFKTALGKTTDPKVVTLYNLYKGTATSGYTLETNITLERPGETVSYGEKVENQSKTISYTLSGATQAGDYSIVFPSTGSSITVGNYTLKFYEGASPQTKPPVFSIAENKITISISYVDSTKQHPYNGQKKGKITITFEADNEIAGYGDYISNFFKASINNGGKEISKPSGTTSGKTAQWVFETGVDVKDYKVTISDGVNHTEYVKNCAHDAYPNNIIYKITKAPLTVNFEPSGSTTYEYNTYHQGLSAVKLSGLYQNIDNGNKYDSVAITIIFNNNSYAVTINKNNSAVDVTNYINTCNVGNYTATIANSVGGAKDSNYYISNTSVSTSWTITPHVLKLDGLEQDGTKIYDGAAVTPKLTVGGNNVTNGKTTYNDDTIQIKYSATLNGVAAKGIVNAGIYNISIGGSSAENAIKATRDGEDTTKNYTISGTDSATYTISKRPITVTWNMSTLKFVYDLTPHGLTVSGITGGGVGAILQSSSLDTAIVKTGYGNDVIKFTLQGKKVDVGKNYVMSIANSALNGIIVNDEVESTIDNYVISGTTCEKKFEIEKSQIIIKYAGGTTSKVYDAGFGISGKPFVFNTQSQNGGAHGTSELFDISYVYKDKNVGDNKEVAFTYVFKQDPNYEYVGTGTESQNKGQITPAHIQVALNKLRSGKATRTFTNNEWYGGQAGASGNNRSQIYRAGEGFSVSGVLGNDSIVVTASYREALDSRNGTGNSFDLSKYVNDVEKNEKTFGKAEAGTHFKTLVFTMTGDDAKNYTFNVYNKLGTDGKKYSEKDSTAGDKQTVTVYDTDDKANGNANGAEQIKIEITVKSVRVDYGNAYQSYAKADNTYNTEWEPITATSQDITAADGTIDVVNNWMYENNDPTKPKREYHGYTTIRGSEKSTVLGATISKDNGMNFNFRLINQPVLTIAYIVENNGTYEIDTLARLLIASFYYTAHQNPGDQIFMQIMQSGYKWFEVVKGEDYSQVEFAPDLENSPITVDDTIKTWDAYINALNEAGYAVFYNETEKAWGCYVSNSSQPTALPNSYKLTKDISGKFTSDDIKVLDAFFTVTTADDNGQFTTKKYTWSGANSDYLKNVLSAAVDKVATINGSLFVSQKAEGAAAITGFDSTFDGNGYVIEYLNIMGYDKENVGLFDIIGAKGSVKNLHLRNITINANQGNVGGIAGSIAAADGDADATKNVTNVSFHGKITATGGTVGGLFGTSARAIDGAIVLGEISATNANVGGVVGTATADLTKVVSMMQITASGGTVGAFTSDNAYVGEKCTHMTNAVWKSGTGFVNVDGKNFGYNALMSSSNSLYANGTSDLGTYDVISETFADSGQNVNPRQSKRLRDMVSVYLLMYSLSVNNGTYTISSSSWLVGTADGTDNNKIVIANKQNVSLLRELRFAAFVLKANVSIDIASTFSGAFYGSVTSETDKNYKIICNKQMFEAYATTTQAWLVTPTQP